MPYAVSVGAGSLRSANEDAQHFPHKWHKVAKVNVFFADIRADFATFNEIYSRYFPELGGPGQPQTGARGGRFITRTICRGRVRRTGGIDDPVRPRCRGIKVTFGRNADAIDSDAETRGLAVDVIEYATSRRKVQ
jgi:hypothetical protein